MGTDSMFVSEVLEGVLLGGVCVVGLLGNTLALLVLWRVSPKQPTVIFLMALSLSDWLPLLYLLLTMALAALTSLGGHHRWSRDLRIYDKRHLWAVGCVFQVWSVWITVMVSLDRWMVVCRPFLARRVSTKKWAIWSVVLTFLGAVVFSTPRVFHQTFVGIEYVPFEPPHGISGHGLNASSHAMVDTRTFEDPRPLSSEDEASDPRLDAGLYPEKAPPPDQLRVNASLTGVDDLASAASDSFTFNEMETLRVRRDRPLDKSFGQPGGINDQSLISREVIGVLSDDEFASGLDDIISVDSGSGSGSGFDYNDVYGYGSGSSLGSGFILESVFGLSSGFCSGSDSSVNEYRDMHSPVYIYHPELYDKADIYHPELYDKADIYHPELYDKADIYHPFETRELLEDLYVRAYVRFLADNVWYKYVYYMGVSWLLVYVAPIAVLSVLNCLLVRALRQASRDHATLTGRSCVEVKANFGVTLSIIAIVTAFLLCQTPDFVIILMQALASTPDDKTVHQLSLATNILLAVNSSVNVILYTLFYRKFRSQIKAMVTCRPK